MWTVKINIFEKGIDTLLRKEQFRDTPQHLIELLQAAKFESTIWASFSIVNPAGEEKGNGVVTSPDSIVYTLQQITIPQVNMDLEDFYAGKCSL